MNISYVFQIGLLYNILQQAYLKNRYALVIHKDLHRIIWASPAAAKSLGYENVYDAINKELILSNKDIAKLNSFMQQANGNLDMIDIQLNFTKIPLKAKLVSDFTNCQFTHKYLSIDIVSSLAQSNNAILLIEPSVLQAPLSRKLNFTDLLQNLETKQFASAIISNDGSLVSSLGYMGGKLCRKTPQGNDVHKLPQLASLILKLKEIIYYRDKPLLALAQNSRDNILNNVNFNPKNSVIVSDRLIIDNEELFFSCLGLNIADNSSIGANISSYAPAHRTSNAPLRRIFLAIIDLYPTGILPSSSSPREVDSLDLSNATLDKPPMWQPVLNADLDVEILCNEAVGKLAALAQDYKVNIHRKIESGLPKLKSDYKDLNVIIYNLLKNAIEYNKPQGNVFMELKRAKDGSLNLVITDSGVGIEKSQLEALLKPVNTENMNNLAFSKFYIEKMGGVFKIDTQPLIGTKIDLFL